MTIDKEFESFLFSQDDGEMYSSAYRRAWQAARSIAAHKIADFDRYQLKTEGVIATLENTILDLEAQNKALEKALEKAAKFIGELNFSLDRDLTLREIEQALALDKKG